MEIQEIKQKINGCLDKLYLENPCLFELVENKIRCERCLVFRFAYYLQNEFPDFFVDCDYNSSIINGQRRIGKPIPDENGVDKNRFVDIIIHKRNEDIDTDFICFEFKREDNYQGRRKDINNLKRLTSIYRYKFGFHIILGMTKEKTKIKVFQNGEEIQTN